eukprot:scaffold4677_cov125-Skeletonema_marinoi.AAC.5
MIDGDEWESMEMLMKSGTKRRQKRKAESGKAKMQGSRDGKGQQSTVESWGDIPVGQLHSIAVVLFVKLGL